MAPSLQQITVVFELDKPSFPPSPPIQLVIPPMLSAPSEPWVGYRHGYSLHVFSPTSGNLGGSSPETS